MCKSGDSTDKACENSRFASLFLEFDGLVTVRLNPRLYAIFSKEKMMTDFRFCNDRFQLDTNQVVDPRAAVSWPALGDEELIGQIASRFEEPLDFPPIAQAVLPEDLIAIAVELDTPCGLPVARLVRQQFVSQGMNPENIQIVCGEEMDDSGDDYVVHDANDADQMAFLFGDRDGNPCYVNRFLFDADVVVPVGTGDGGRRRNTLCAAFCDHETQKQLGRLKPEQAAAIERMVDDNLGVFWQVRVITAPGNQVIQIMVGASEAVLEKSSEFGNDAWSLQVDQTSDLVVATIESACAQTWSHLRTAIINADKVAGDQAILVLCTDLKGKPPTSWPIPDTPAEKHDELLADVLRQHPLYLVSGLTQDATERYGFGYLKDSEQLQKLVRQNQTALVIRDAHRVKVLEMEGC